VKMDELMPTERYPRHQQVIGETNVLKRILRAGEVDACQLVLWMEKRPRQQPQACLGSCGRGSRGGDALGPQLVREVERQRHGEADDHGQGAAHERERQPRSLEQTSRRRSGSDEEGRKGSKVERASARGLRGCRERT